jgi:mono/diheme cytochrome c family protein
MSVRSIIFISGLWLAACTPGLSDARIGPTSDDDRVFVEAATPEQIDAGRRIVQLQCVTCHAVRSSDVSRDLTAPPLRTLAERYPVTGLADVFAKGVLVGHPNMPDFRFNATQITEILAYLQSIQTRQGA